jgi:hypothetical protein
MSFFRPQKWSPRFGNRKPRRRPGPRLALERLEDRVTPAAVSWTGNGDGLNWSDAHNWSANRLPGPGDDVTINSQTTPVIVHSTGNDLVHSLTSANALLLSGGQLSLSAPSAVDNTLLLVNATLTDSGGLDVQGLEQSGGNLNGAGDLTIEQQWLWSGGQMSSPGHTVLNGSGSISNANLSGRIVENHGTVAVAAGTSFNLVNDAVWDNDTDGTFVLQPGSSLGGGGGATAFNNDGLFQKVGTGAVTINLVLNNTGTVDVQAGTLTLNGGGTSSGTFDLEDSSALSVGGATYYLLDGAAVTDTGTLQVNGNLNVAGAAGVQALTVNGGAVFVTGPLTAASLSLNGTLTGPGDVTVNGTFTFTGGGLTGTGQTFLEGTSSLGGGFFATLSDRIVNNDGTATITNGGITVTNNGVWNNDAGATTVLQNGAAVGNFFAGPQAAFNNAGLLQTAGVGSPHIDIPLTNAATGTVQVQVPAGNTFSASGLFQNAGTVTVAANATFSVGNYTQTAGSTTVDGTLSAGFGGAVTLNGGALNGAGTINANVTNAAVLTPGDSPGILHINGNYTQTADGVLNIEIGGLTAGTQYDRLVVSGSATLNGTLNVILLNGFLPSPGDSFQVLTFGSHTGTFSTFTGLDLGNGHSLNPVFNTNGHELDLVTV